MPKYHIFFFGLCYACNNYGHKAIDSRAYARDRNAWRRNSYENTQYQSKRNIVRKLIDASECTYYRFGALDYKIECYRCSQLWTHSQKLKKQVYRLIKLAKGRQESTRITNKIENEERGYAD